MSRFIVIDGLDGSGKGTQIKLMQKHFEHRPVAFTREPGGTPRAERIREILLSPSKQSADPLTDLLLFFAARNDHIQYLIEPLRMEGKHVISDRYDSSSFAFQLYGEGRYESLIEEFKFLRLKMIEGVIYSAGNPDAYIFLDLPAQIAYDRCRLAADKTSVFDLKPIQYHERVREGFRAFAERYADMNTAITLIDANRPVEEVQAEIVEEIERLFAEDNDNSEE